MRWERSTYLLMLVQEEVTDVVCQPFLKLEDNCFTMLCLFLLHSTVSRPYVNISPLS